MSVAKRKTVTPKKSPRGRGSNESHHVYLRRNSIRHFDLSEDAADVVGLLHEREDNRMSMRDCSFDITCLD